MQWIQSIFMSIATMFGGGADVPAEQPVVAEVIEERMEEEVMEDVADTMLSDEKTVSDTEAVTQDIQPEEEVEVVDVSMTGTAKPVTPVAEKPDLQPAVVSESGVRSALVAGGCFWCTESDLEKLPGVISAVSGYAGGTTDNPNYSNYGSGGHREVVEVTYNADLVSFEEVLIKTLKTTDPTDDDGTFGDRGDKYSSALYYETPEEKAVIDNLIAEIDQYGPYDAPLAVDVEARPVFWAAEDRHQDYYKGTLTKLKYQYYRNASGRNTFIEKYWGTDTGATLPWRTTEVTTESVSLETNETKYMWETYVKPSKKELKTTLDPLAYKVTQEDGTERAGTSPLDKIWDDGIYVDILSGAPLYSSKDKFDSGTGWPSFVKPITEDAITEHEDRKLFSVRTETRSRYGDNHIGHVFTDGPDDRGGLRYCMNGVALRFVPKADMEAEGYGDFLQYI